MARQRKQPARRATTRRESRCNGSSTSSPRKARRRTGASSTRRRPTWSRPPRRSRRRSITGPPGGRSATRRRPGRASAGRRRTRWCAGISCRPSRIARTDRLSPRFIWMAAKETDQFNTRPTTFIEAEGTSLKSALDIARKYGVLKDGLLPFATGQLYPGSAKAFYAIAAQLKILAYFNLGTNLHQLADVARDEGADPHAARRRRHVAERDGDQGQARRLPRGHDGRRARGRPRRLPARPLHRAEQLGHRLGRQGLCVRLARLRAGGLHGGVRDRSLSAAARGGGPCPGSVPCHGLRRPVDQSRRHRRPAPRGHVGQLLWASPSTRTTTHRPAQRGCDRPAGA